MTSTAAVTVSAPASRAKHREPRLWHLRSIGLISLAWAILYLGGIFSPGLLDDVDSIYIEVAREMLQRHDFVTPFVDGIRFFDKPPLMYWLAAGSMHIFGVHDWAARLPLVLGVLALLFAVYGLGIRLFAEHCPQHAPDRAGLYGALAMAVSIGPWLYTRFYIPDILIALWMTLAVHLFLVAVERASTRAQHDPSLGSMAPTGRSANDHHVWSDRRSQAPLLKTPAAGSPLLPMLGFAGVLALSVLTKGLIGVVFPVAFAILYLALTRQLTLLTRLSLLPSTLSFLAIAAPWHILAALRNPAIPMPRGVGLPARAGWAWFYLYNEHVARFIGRRIPHDYGQVPVPLFWLLLAVWLFPWAIFLPSAIAGSVRHLRGRVTSNRSTQAAFLALFLWAAIVLGFFTLSSRQEYYHLPALPALALLVGAFLAGADLAPWPAFFGSEDKLRRHALGSSLYGLVPLGILLFLTCGYFALSAPAPRPGTTLNDLLSSNPALYNLSLGHLFDLTGTAMAFFRWPLLVVAVSGLILGPVQHLVRRSRNGQRGFAANLLVAAAMTGMLLAAHQSYVRFNPILGSKDLAATINAQRHPGDLVMIDGELTSGSSLLFYTQQPALLVNGRINGPWFGSFFPDAPHIFRTDQELARLWAGPQRIFLLTYNPTRRQHELLSNAPVYDLMDSGGKTLLSNQP